MVEWKAASIYVSWRRLRSDTSPAVRVKFIGAAFADVWHGPHGATPTAHGRCNSVPSAVWELHPVFKVATP